MKGLTAPLTYIFLVCLAGYAIIAIECSGPSNPPPVAPTTERATPTQDAKLHAKPRVITPKDIKGFQKRNPSRWPIMLEGAWMDETKYGLGVFEFFKKHYPEKEPKTAVFAVDDDTGHLWLLYQDCDGTISRVEGPWVHE